MEAVLQQRGRAAPVPRVLQRLPRLGGSPVEENFHRGPRGTRR